MAAVHKHTADTSCLKPERQSELGVLQSTLKVSHLTVDHTEAAYSLTSLVSGVQTTPNGTTFCKCSCERYMTCLKLSEDYHWSIVSCRVHCIFRRLVPAYHNTAMRRHRPAVSVRAVSSLKATLRDCRDVLFMILLHYWVCNICNMSLLAYVPHSSTGFYVAIFLFYLSFSLACSSLLTIHNILQQCFNNQQI